MFGIEAFLEDTVSPSIPFAPPRAQAEETEDVENQTADTILWICKIVTFLLCCCLV